MAVGGNASATVTWTAPANGGSPITSYVVTPYLAGVAQTATTVTGTPPAPAATLTGLINGQSYTFTVTAANAVGTSPPSAPSGAVTPSAATVPKFVQQANAHVLSGSTISVTPAAPLGTGNRLIVEVGVRRPRRPRQQASLPAGDAFTE